MMLRSGDLNLNQFGGSVKEAVKRTMIQHEIIFKNQVRELHRLYWTQKNLMQEAYRKELATNKCREMLASQSQAVGNVGCMEEAKVKIFDSNNGRHSGLDLELPPIDYIGSSANESINNGRFIGCSVMLSPDSSSKMHIDENGENASSLLDKGKSLYCYEVINLEEPTEIGSDVQAYRVNMGGFKLPISAPGVFSSLVPTLNNLHVDYGEQCLDKKAEHAAAGGSQTAADAVDPSLDSTRRREPPASKSILFDLNIAQDEEPSQGLNDPLITFPSTSSCSSIVQNELLCKGQVNYGWQNETSHASLLTPKESDSARLSPDCQDSQRSQVSDICQKKEHYTCDKIEGPMHHTECYNSKSAEGFSIDSSGELLNNAKGTALSSAGFSELTTENGDFSSNKQHFFTHRDIKRQSDMKNQQANCEGSEEDTVSSHVVALHDNQHDQLDKNFVLECERSTEENSGTTQVDNMSVDTSQQNGTLAIADAAEILANIYLLKPSTSVLEADNVMEEDETEHPQYSTDSFEAMTLELPEVQSNEHFISSLLNHSEDLGTGDTSPVNRLRRGRGRAVRDFQRDILPGMVTLSRHEIFEDMHNIGYELRRNGSRRAYGGTWFMPVRSRRSRRYPVGGRQ